MKAGGLRSRAIGVLAALLLAGCASQAPQAPSAGPEAAPTAPEPPAAERPAPAPASAGGDLIGRSERLLVVRPGPADTAASVAARWLGSADLAWQVSDANPGAVAGSGQPLVVPLKPLNPLGVQGDRMQTVPILCYHRLGPGSNRMVISPSNFEAQMTWLVRNDYRIIRLADLAGFLAGERALPARSVVVTFDDGYESVHRHAFPVLKRLGIPATVFVYTDFLGGGDALTWPQLQEMQASGLVDIQSHSKSHRNLVERLAGETDDRYRAAIEQEMRVPRDTLERRLPPLKVRHLAYPFGDANEIVVDSAGRNGFELAATVTPGGNPFYAQPLLLRRTMIYGDMSLDTFRAKLQVSRPLSAP